MLYGSARQLAVSQKVPWPVVGKVVGAGPSEGRGVQSRACAAQHGLQEGELLFSLVGAILSAFEWEGKRRGPQRQDG